MDAQQTTKYLGQLPGIEGCFITSASGQILASSMPTIFDEAILQDMALGSSNILETFKAEMPDCQELVLNMELKTLYVHEAENALIFILLDGTEKTDNVRVGAKVAAKRLSIPQSPSQTVLPQDDPPSHDTQKSVSISTAIFGSRKKDKETKPKASIWE